MSLGPAVADPDDEVALQEECVGPALVGLDADDSGVERVVLTDEALAHVRWGHRYLEVLGELHKLFPGFGDHDPAAGHEHRPLGLEDHLDRVPDGVRVGFGCLEGQPTIELWVVLHLLALRHVERQVYEDRAGASLARYLEGLTEDPGYLRRLLGLHGPLGDRLGDLHDLYGLEGLLVQHVRRGLAVDANDRYRVCHRRVETRDHVRPRGSRGTDADAYLPRHPCVTVRRVRPALLVAHREGLDLLRTFERLE